jgi:hypothetical protein
VREISLTKSSVSPRAGTRLKKAPRSTILRGAFASPARLLPLAASSNPLYLFLLLFFLCLLLPADFTHLFPPSGKKLCGDAAVPGSNSASCG